MYAQMQMHLELFNDALVQTYDLQTSIEISTRKQAQQSIHTAVDKLGTLYEALDES
jgi:hypothetical protein